MVIGSVALPVWKSKDIVWLCMESLCAQHKPIDGWELIIFEGRHDDQAGEEFFRSYENRLKKVGCERIEYLTADVHIPLSQKWIKIAQSTSETSEYFMMCAADNYYHPWMIQDFENAHKVADWCLLTKGYFYDFYIDRVLMYNNTALVGLQMSAKTSMVRQFPMDELNRGVDSWFSERLREVAHKNSEKLNVWMDGSDHWEKTLCTNGYNNISTSRVNYFLQPRHPFYDTNKKLEEIVPKEINFRIRELCQQSL